jgi:hypothetical protein
MIITQKNSRIFLNLQCTRFNFTYLLHHQASRNTEGSPASCLLRCGRLLCLRMLLFLQIGLYNEFPVLRKQLN